MKINANQFTIDSRRRELRFYIRKGHIFSYLINRFRWHYYPRMHYVSSFPDHVDIEASSACNMKCPMCFHHKIPKDQVGSMDFDLYKKIVDECAAHKIFSIRLSWRGEPLLNPKLPEMVRYAKQKGIKDVSFLTNGLLLDGELARELIMADLNYLVISFDGLGETYESIRKPAKYEEAIKRIERFQQMKKGLGKSRPVVRVNTVWSAIEKDPAAYKRVMTPLVDFIVFNPDKDFYGEINHDPNFVCPYPWQRLIVAWDGNVTTCCMDYNNRFQLGNVEHQTIQEIWHGDNMKYVREKHVKKQRLALEACKACPEGRIHTIMGNRRNV